MKTENINEIKFNKFPLKFKPQKKKKVMAIDTETTEGKAFILSFFSDDMQGVIPINCYQDIIDFFSKRELRNYLIFAFNLIVKS